MPTKLVRLTEAAVDILRTYAGEDSLSRGVIAIQELFQEKDREILRLKEIADRLQGQVGEMQSMAVTGSKHWTNTGSQITEHNAEYWDKLRRVFQESKGTTSNGFQQASKLVVTPVRTIGKISEEEKLVEPVGRQGRDVR
jgi:hypothetical protein